MRENPKTAPLEHLDLLFRPSTKLLVCHSRKYGDVVQPVLQRAQQRLVGQREVGRRGVVLGP